MAEALTYALAFLAACAGLSALAVARWFWKIAPARRRRGLAGAKADAPLGSDAPISPQARKWVKTS